MILNRALLGVLGLSWITLFMFILNWNFNSSNRNISKVLDLNYSEYVADFFETEAYLNQKNWQDLYQFLEVTQITSLDLERVLELIESKKRDTQNDIDLIRIYFIKLFLFPTQTDPNIINAIPSLGNSNERQGIIDNNDSRLVIEGMPSITSDQKQFLNYVLLNNEILQILGENLAVLTSRKRLSREEKNLILKDINTLTEIIDNYIFSNIEDDFYINDLLDRIEQGYKDEIYLGDDKEPDVIERKETLFENSLDSIRTSLQNYRYSKIRENTSQYNARSLQTAERILSYQ